jgi:hypothetical protein
VRISVSGLFWSVSGLTGTNQKWMGLSSMQQHQEQVATARIHIKHETQEHLMQVDAIFCIKVSMNIEF